MLRLIVGVVAVVQAGVLGLLARRGSWLSDDLDFLVQGSRGFAPAELLAPVNDHVAPGLRFTYAVFAQVAPLNHDVTVAYRVLLQAAAIALFGALLIRLLDGSWWVAAGTFLYALSPLSMPSFMSLSSGVNNLSAHVFGLLLLHATVDWARGRRLRAVAYGPLALLISLAYWEKSGLIVLTVLALVVYLNRGSKRSWLLYGAALAVPAVAFGTLYLLAGSPSAGQFPGPAELVRLAGLSLRVPVTALVGGPWTWDAPTSPFGLASPPVVATVLGGLVLAGLLLVAWRRDRPALALWAAVLGYVVVTFALLAYARFALFGDAFTGHYHYWSDLSIPLTLAIVLTLRTARISLALPVLLAWTVGVVVSFAGFAGPWGRNPAKEYFATVRAELDQRGPAVNLWDVNLPGSITLAIAENNRLSPVLRAARIPFRLQAPGSEPYTVNEQGRLRPSTLAAWSFAEPADVNPLCDLLVRGTEPVRLPLRLPPRHGRFHAANWFARVSYYANRENQLVVQLLDDDGRAVTMPAPAGGWPAGADLTAMYLGPSPRIRATAVRLSSADPETNICIGEVDVGLPVEGGR